MNGQTFLAIVFAVGILAILVLVGILIYRKLRENESLKYEFITIIAHKFRTPLTSIKWASESLMQTETDGYKRESLDQIHVSNEKLIKLTSTLVELTESSKGASSGYQMERLNLCELTHGAVENAKRVFREKNLFVSAECSEQDIFVTADRARLDFVVSTLLENACSYSQPGRNVRVTVGTDGRKAAVSVTDNGIGMDQHEMNRLFTKFYRSKDSSAMDTEGLGIGLYLALSIMKRHGGTIEPYSEGHGKGSTFTVIMPKAK